MQAISAKIHLYGTFTNGNFRFGMLQQNATFKASSAASLSFDHLFLTFTCKVRASMNLKKTKDQYKYLFFSIYHRYVINGGVSLHKSSAVQVIFFLSLSFFYFLVLLRPWILPYISVACSSLRIT